LSLTLPKESKKREDALFWEAERLPSLRDEAIEIYKEHEEFELCLLGKPQTPTY
jgi:hypothetical protein